MSITSLLEQKMLPLAERISANIYLTALKNAFIALIPFLIVGSFFLLLTNFPIAGYNELMTSLLGKGTLDKLNYGINASYGLMTLLVIITFSKELVDKLNLSQSTAILPVAIFFLMLPGSVTTESGGLVADAYALLDFSSESMFLGIIVTVITIKMVQFLENHAFTIKMPESVPSEIAKSFKSLVPILVVLLFWIIVKTLFAATHFGTPGKFISVILQEPLLYLGNSIFSQLVAETMISLFWFFGIHGDSIVTSVMGPIWQTLSAQNLAQTQEGLAATNIITQQFRDVYLIAGGTGFTGALLISIFMVAKSTRLKQLSKLAAPAAIFNINEPIIFGLPIVLNPLMLIPFLITPIVLCTITYVVIALGWVPPTSGISIPWTTPIFVSGFLTTGFSGVILQAVNLIIATAIYLPFVKILDKQYLHEEHQMVNASGVLQPL
ncbi:TPA: PTS sugar transporter subunit IIC [Kluyvera ascorbata]|uniref:Permease IIC component n=1 Tax=Kluyvera genomosp. 2 TaxID=2774054 RepID=A0A2T2Y127_9ENTR|nr:MULTISPECIES: PTS transporter subunit EIIC [Enterobacteriaceae]HAT3918846.1 PTS sugar transporter subunit IIC [Kluyvera ascorbata]PSR46250.1 PTS cellobiose IIC subunit [Kluyvera genomosp. 2]BBQ85883.1 permease IIC component [Klebsiella sp. WP3-W18-ESBL-02]BBR22866.1 permease IIC component [Klebsiella sp. WP3-S18-ESBL-05]HAT3943759.1 PTS sugar transporter subunit IIC [Kluyvera ascorbata]